MSNVFTMSGAPLLRAGDLLQRLQERGDIEHVVVVVERKDGYSELWWDKQSVSNVVFASTALRLEADKLAAAAIDAEAPV